MRHTSYLGIAVTLMFFAAMGNGAEPAKKAKPPSNKEQVAGIKEVVYGSVLSIEDYKSKDETGLQVNLRTEKGDLVILVGPRSLWPEHDLNLTHGEPLTVVGAKITFDGKPAFIAHEISQGEKRVEIRKPSNAPRP